MVVCAVCRVVSYLMEEHEQYGGVFGEDLVDGGEVVLEPGLA
jgi:hypothetical protein